MKFTSKEKELNQQIEALMDEWRKQVKRNSSEDVAASHEVKNLSELFVPDGFYPHYFNQKRKILFIGRECLGLKDCESYIDALHWAIKHNKEVGGKALNRCKFHALMMYVAYGIQNGYPDFNDIPYASALADSFAEEGGFSYAYMNISKLSNENEEWVLDRSLVESFLKVEGTKDFFAEELSILKPDLIIGLNIMYSNIKGLCKEDYMGSFHYQGPKGESKKPARYDLVTSKGEHYPFIDSYHFSAPAKSWEEDYYKPIIELCKQIFKEG